MESRAKAGGHSIHQQLVAFPLGLLTTAVVFDAIGLVLAEARFASAAHLMIAAGVLTGLAAALFGSIDFTSVPAHTRARRVGTVHAAGNVAMLALFSLAWLLRSGAADAAVTPAVFALEVLAVSIAGMAGWLGGELVSRLGVGVDDGAGLDAPASFRTGIRRTGGAAHP